MIDLDRCLTKFLQRKWPRSIVAYRGVSYYHPRSLRTIQLWFKLVFDPETGIKHRAVAVLNLKHDELSCIISSIHEFANLELFEVSFSNIDQPSGHPINTRQMPNSAKIILYTNKIMMPMEDILSAFELIGILIELKEEQYQSVFISYGAPDINSAEFLNNYLLKQGVETGFFPEDNSPGEKIHRYMKNSVTSYDRVLFLCSKNSLNRTGTQNELERTLEREAKEGGSDILIPVALDNFIYEWTPSRLDFPSQITSRTILHLDSEKLVDQVYIEQKLKNLLSSLRKI